MSRIIDNGVKFFCAGAVTVSGCRQGSPATLGFMALSRIAKRLERGSATSNNAALSVTAAELATTLTQNAETIRQSLNTIAESGFFTTFGPRPGEARALSVEIDRSNPHLEFAERLERGAEWWVYTNRRLLPVSDFSRKFVALQLSTFATQSTHRDISRAAEFGRYRGIASALRILSGR